MFGSFIITLPISGNPIWYINKRDIRTLIKLHNLVRCIVGLLGIVSYTNLNYSRFFNRGFAVAYILLAIMGLLPYTRTTFGLMPLFGNNVLINALTAIAAAYYGFVLPNKVEKASLSQDV